MLLFVFFFKKRICLNVEDDAKLDYKETVTPILKEISEIVTPKKPSKR